MAERILQTNTLAAQQENPLFPVVNAQFDSVSEALPDQESQIAAAQKQILRTSRYIAGTKTNDPDLAWKLCRQQLHNITPRSLNQVVNYELNEELGDVIADTLNPSVENCVENKVLGQTLNELVERLTYKYQQVIIQRYVLGKTQEEIGRSLGITRQRVQTIEKLALKKLRRFADEKGLRDFLE